MKPGMSFSNLTFCSSTMEMEHSDGLTERSQGTSGGQFGDLTGEDVSFQGKVRQGFPGLKPRLEFGSERCEQLPMWYTKREGFVNFEQEILS